MGTAAALAWFLAQLAFWVYLWAAVAMTATVAAVAPPAACGVLLWRWWRRRAL